LGACRCRATSGEGERRRTERPWALGGAALSVSGEVGRKREGGKGKRRGGRGELLCSLLERSGGEGRGRVGEKEGREIFFTRHCR